MALLKDRAARATACRFRRCAARYQLGNAATALAAVDALRERLPVPAGAVRDGLVHVELPGRFQVLPGRPAVVLDVAHNPHAARVLADALAAMGYFPRTFAVFGMLADKDIDARRRSALAPRIDALVRRAAAGSARRAGGAARSARSRGAGVREARDPRVRRHRTGIRARARRCERD